MENRPPSAPELLRKYGLRPDKRLGQNFLVDETALQKVVDAAGLQPGEAVLEIGPGLGGLTRLLAERSRWVTAVELDKALLPPLKEALAGFTNITVIHGDILALDPRQLIEAMRLEPASDSHGRYRVVANIPYYITSAVIRRLLEAPTPPVGMTLTVQREVAERITAAPGEMSLLALSIKVYGEPHIAARIPAGAFYPPPKVDSSVIRVDLYPKPLIADVRTFFRLAKAGFSQKRKTLRNALSAGLAIEKEQAAELLLSAGIDPRRRAETLDLTEWSALVDANSTSGPEQHD